MPHYCANLSLLYTEVPLEARLSKARQDGFEAFEIQFPYELPSAHWRQLMDKANIRCVLFNVPAGDLMQGGEGLAAVPERAEKFRSAVDKALEYARVLRPSVINVLPGRCLRDSQRDVYLEQLKINLQYAADHFSALGITTCFEAINTEDMPGFLVHTSKQMAELVTAVDHPMIKMQYDLYHMAKMDQPIVDDLRDYAADIGHIQFADNPGRGEPGSGQLNLGGLFQQIDRSSYKGWVGAEYRPTELTSNTLAWRRW
ncbi:TIM barrel protein [Aestuariirhabdus sp. Z084]|uniref:hydroxypyruvate isomerase family protein n=1 Tax=Aestuariirhabdus haliotis TaxID=2918751 RepID=UPI00201B3C86|nr:TIM barrel protein [Aestuariirhabdus haliotis]MCL6416693.1 TIM barrel protein [Aestuariirhabdus haliotis]MCL6420718.1 TIM barrel protein [Aestuariirhabdus haliotis]